MNEPQNSLHLGIAAYKAGEKAKARSYLLMAVREQPDSERAWGWLSNTAANAEERIHCLRQVVRINPANKPAAKLLHDLESNEWLKAGASDSVAAPLTPASVSSDSTRMSTPPVRPTTDRQTQLPAQKQQRFLISLVALFVGVCVVLIAGGYGWYYYYGPCGVNLVRDAGLALADQFDIYQDAYNTASATSRAALSVPISQLRDIKRQTELIPVPACLEGARWELVQTTEATIQVFLSFESQNDIGVDIFLDQATSHLAEFRTQLEIVETCKPFCQTR